MTSCIISNLIKDSLYTQHLSVPSSELFLNYPNIEANIRKFVRRLHMISQSHNSRNINNQIQNRLKQGLTKLTTQLHNTFNNYSHLGTTLLAGTKKLRQYIKIDSPDKTQQQDAYKQIKKMIEYYEGSIKGRLETPSKQYRDRKMIEIQERISAYYENKRMEKQLQSQTNILNFLIGPDYDDKFQDGNCLRCNSYFIKGNRSNIYHPAMSFYPVTAFELKNYDDFSAIEGDVRGSICSMLNQPNGGIILLGCKKSGSFIFPDGLYITEKSKDSLMQKIESFLSKIYPKVKRNQEVYIDFVPMMELDKQSKDGSGSVILRRIQQKIREKRGQFVCRIFVQPAKPYQTYFIKSITNDKLKFSSIYSCNSTKSSTHDSTYDWSRQEFANVTINNSIQYEFMREKFKKDYDHSNKGQKPQSCHYNIKCCEPGKGLIVFEEDPELKSATSYYNIESTMEATTGSFRLEKQIYTQKKGSEKPCGNVEIKQMNAYKFWTLVVGDKNTMNKILECVNGKQKKGVRIEKLFEDHNFKLTKTTWVMFHDEKFEAMKKLIERYNITYKSKEVKMIASNLYLQIDNGIDHFHYSQLYQILIDHVGANIKDATIKVSNGFNNWVVFFDSFKGAIFSYFYLSELGYKSKFIRGASLFLNQPYQTSY